jgi:hypothetical protein
MSLSFITGAPGAGKTAVTNEIAGRGYTIYDTDDPNHTGIAGWHNLQTGEYVAGFNELAVTEELLATHIWRPTPSALKDFSSRAQSESIYLCGRLRDAKPVIEASRHLLFLTVSAATIEQRLAQRASIPGEVDWGREPWQVERSVFVNRELEAEYRALRAVMINADQPLVAVVDEIVSATQG